MIRHRNAGGGHETTHRKGRRSAHRAFKEASSFHSYSFHDVHRITEPFVDLSPFNDFVGHESLALDPTHLVLTQVVSLI